MMLVSIEDARKHLRIDDYSGSSADDPWLEIMIPAISQAVLLWLKDAWRAYELERDSSDDIILDSNSEPITLEDSNGPIIKPVVRAAVLVELASQYRFREGEGVAHVPSHWGYGYTLSVGATALLTPLRKSTIV